MQITTASITFFLILFCFGNLLVLPTLWLTLSILTPKKLLDKYFKEPHFSLTETYMMREFPGFLFRTTIWAWVLTFPKLDKNRKLSQIKNFIPVWYGLGLKALLFFSTSFLFIFLTLLLVLLILIQVYEPQQIIITVP